MQHTGSLRRIARGGGIAGQVILAEKRSMSACCMTTQPPCHGGLGCRRSLDRAGRWQLHSHGLLRRLAPHKARYDREGMAAELVRHFGLSASSLGPVAKERLQPIGPDRDRARQRLPSPSLPCCQGERGLVVSREAVAVVQVSLVKEWSEIVDWSNLAARQVSGNGPLQHLPKSRGSRSMRKSQLAAETPNFRRVNLTHRSRRRVRSDARRTPCT
jgi:hypothetical protein